MKAYCLRCREKTEINEPQFHRMRNGCGRVSGVCQCGTRLSSIISKKKVLEKNNKGGNLFTDIADVYPTGIPLMASIGLL